jgi:hypothetical protein
MVSLTALRQHPRFGRFFEVVHPFFWPVIWWTLNAVFRQYDASNRTEFLLGITWWGKSTSPSKATCGPIRGPTDPSLEPSVP